MTKLEIAILILAIAFISMIRGFVRTYLRDRRRRKLDRKFREFYNEMSARMKSCDRLGLNRQGKLDYRNGKNNR
jgi:hypothetical protein